ncbi:MAG: sigma-70 family RNA polymerase sigma factor [Candidatus Acidiferrales bacterium]|jgi:RNA polymerase sigma-70 factor
MAQDSILESRRAFATQYAQVISVLHTEAKSSRWELSLDAFAESLYRSAEKRFHNSHATPLEIESYLKSLHLEDLALAAACNEGIETAWEFFIGSFRQELRNASRAILRVSGSNDDARAEELADSLYADLYGIRSASDGRRKSLFTYFHGRSKLSTWLRAVLAQRCVDLLRASGRTTSLEDEREGDMPHEIAARAKPTLADPNRAKYLARLDRSLTVALAELSPRERLILACYYLDKLTLAEIGRMLREHESTVSRQLERIRRSLRETVMQRMLASTPARDACPAEPGLDAAQAALAFEYALEEWPFDLSRALSTGPTETDAPEK